MRYQARITKQTTAGGQAMLIAMILFLVGSMIIVFGIVSPVLREVRNTNALGFSKQSYFLAEASVEDVTYRLMHGMELSSVETLAEGEAVASVSVQTTGSVKRVEAEGVERDHYRSLGLTLTQGETAGLHYGIQVGNGGISMNGGTRVNGNVYANGPITSTNGGRITGSAISAGPNGLIGGGSWAGSIVVGTWSGDSAWAHTVKGAQVSGALYCATGSTNNKACNTSRSDPEEVGMPLSDATIEGWKDEVIAAIATPITGGWTHNGNLTVNWQGTTTPSLRKVVGNLTLSCSSNPAVFGDLEVTGTLTISSGCQMQAAHVKVGGNMVVNNQGANIGTLEVIGNLSTAGGGMLQAGPIKVGGSLSVGYNALVLKGTMWVVGQVSVASGATVRLHSSYGSGSGVVLSDGRVNLTGGGNFSGSGQTGSYIMLVTTSACPVGCSGQDAIELSGGAGAVILIAQNGTIDMSGGTAARALIAETVRLNSGAVVNYESGLADINFTSGPSGGYSINGWGEVE